MKPPDEPQPPTVEQVAQRLVEAGDWDLVSVRRTAKEAGINVDDLNQAVLRLMDQAPSEPPASTEHASTVHPVNSEQPATTTPETGSSGEQAADQALLRKQLEHELEDLKKDHRKYLSKIRLIKESERYKHGYTDDDGTVYPGYSSFRTWLSERWGHPWSWYTQNCQWLACLEGVEAALPGHQVRLHQRAASLLWRKLGQQVRDDGSPGQEGYPQQMAEVYLEARKAQSAKDGDVVQEEYVKYAIDRRLEYMVYANAREKLGSKVRVLSYEEWRAAGWFGGHVRQEALPMLVTAAKEVESQESDRQKLLDVCAREEKLPSLDAVADYLTKPEDVIWLGNMLAEKAKGWDLAADLEAQKAAVQHQIDAIRAGTATSEKKPAPNTKEEDEWTEMLKKDKVMKELNSIRALFSTVRARRWQKENLKGYLEILLEIESFIRDIRNANFPADSKEQEKVEDLEL
jgi:hypothetical protein